MKRPKLGKWVSAAKVRLTKKNGVTVVEIRRVVKKRKTVKKNPPGMWSTPRPGRPAAWEAQRKARAKRSRARSKARKAGR